MNPRLPNTLLALLVAAILFVGIAVHPSVIVLSVGTTLGVLAILVGFERRQRRRP